MRRLLVSVFALVTMVSATTVVSAHGFQTALPSRAYLCQRGAIPCGDIKYEPQSLVGPNQFPQAGPVDGEICSAGLPQFGELNKTRISKSQPWPTANVLPGSTHNFRWTITARHHTTTFRYYMTREGWQPDAWLSRAQLDPVPFAVVDYHGQLVGASVSHDVTLPVGKQGRHMILAVWDYANEPQAVYNCSDVFFPRD
ncbi:lytic polysaccharide monooxygenase [Kibdelosporangium philippinense]|uniref:Lytic polysaccharide monooxygenase n=2 Tax=Kibdelosporangium philippinense TaxID=211113 RepID=A0ABS8ZN50_9PSEU|nr:lytic polysaccharide monooxygenase auxiliary activity family 9 protein [Kibdelosporangium philippinense]MCE7008994.1 lytic polysaccharide monooxygenase [Kibdelosporangium philippinense]